MLNIIENQPDYGWLSSSSQSLSRLLLSLLIIPSVPQRYITGAVNKSFYILYTEWSKIANENESLSQTIFSTTNSQVVGYFGKLNHVDHVYHVAHKAIASV